MDGLLLPSRCFCIAMRLAAVDPAYRSMMLKFLEHFSGITDGVGDAGMWDPSDGFFYDQLVQPDGERIPPKVRSIVGVIPVLAAAYIQSDNEVYVRDADRLERRFSQFLRRRGLDTTELDRAGFVYRTDTEAGIQTPADSGGPGNASKRVLMEVLSEDLDAVAVRNWSLSRRHPMTLHGERRWSGSSGWTTNRRSPGPRCTAATRTGAGRCGSRSITRDRGT